MNKYVNSETTFHMMTLLQLGASVEVVTGKMVYVEFKLESGLEIAYVYHINKNNKYFLERIKPYPLPIKEVDNSMDVINLIRIDYDQFMNVVTSHINHIEKNKETDSEKILSSNLKTFININKRLHTTMKTLEDLFLYYRLPKGAMTDIEKDIDNIQKNIMELENKSTRTYTEKDPETLNNKKE